MIDPSGIMDSSCSSSDSESDNEGGPPVPVDLNETSDKGLTLVDDNDSGLILQLPPEGNGFHLIRWC